MTAVICRGANAARRVLVVLVPDEKFKKENLSEKPSDP